MALPAPSLADLQTFKGGDPYDTSETSHIDMMLEQATLAVWLDTGLEDYPTDTRAAQVVKYAIMDLTLWLLAQEESRDEINSPFSSERIGSYSYSKMQAARKDGSSGIYWLDRLFQMLSGTDGEASPAWAYSENVFSPCGDTYVDQEAARKVLYPDPSIEVTY